MRASLFRFDEAVWACPRKRDPHDHGVTRKNEITHWEINSAETTIPTESWFSRALRGAVGRVDLENGVKISLIYYCDTWAWPYVTVFEMRGTNEPIPHWNKITTIQLALDDEEEVGRETSVLARATKSEWEVYF